MKFCSKCVLPETFPNIEFNEEGICNYCSKFKNSKVKGENALKIIFNNIKEKSKYDCIIPISGGRDSTFVLYMVTEIFKLNVLAVNFDSGLTDEQAILNMKNAVNQLNVDFISIKSKRDIRKKVLKEHFNSTINKCPEQVLLGICQGCMNCYKSVAYKIANDMNIPLIIWGSSKIEGGTNLRKFIYKNNSWFKSNFVSRLPRYTNIKYLLHLLLLNMEFPYPAIKKNKNIKEISVFDYIEWNEEVILRTIKNNLNWEKSNKYESSWRFDCKIPALQKFLSYYLFGFTDSNELLSNQIRTGEISRNDAIVRLEQEAKDLKFNKLYDYLKQLDLSDKQIQIFTRNLKLREKNQNEH
jgi:3'-phosphoadenosine 5'-phosphosulfate sulfotransferase (PAPS reductase)/FAD synthetase